MKAIGVSVGPVNDEALLHQNAISLPGEFIDDAESLGGLVRDRSLPVREIKRSVEVAYSFPPQDTKLKIGETPRDAATLKGAGTIAELSPEEGRLVLRRGKATEGFPDRLNLVPAPIDLGDLPDAVFAFGERFAAGALLSDKAVVDFLQRSKPRFKGRVQGLPILGDAEDLVDGTKRAVIDLDGSCLFIQGPPGTGKTYTISAMILALLRAGYRIGVSSNSHKAINKVLEEVEKRALETGDTFVGAKKGSRDHPDSIMNSAHIQTVYSSEDVNLSHRLVGGTPFHFCREQQRASFDYLIVDEAGQVALGNLVAMAGSARNIVLVGDQMQLSQPIQGVHPGETGLSCLDYFLQGSATVAPDQGILLNETRRLHPRLCSLISDAIYDGRLKAHPSTAERYLVLQGDAHPAIQPAGLVFLSVPHDGCTQSSEAEAQAVAGVVASLLQQQVRRKDGSVSALSLEEILVVAPYNMQVNLLRQRLPQGARIGTVDKFQGQEAAVTIVSMTTSRGEDAPRGTEFLFNRNRFNVAVSRAECLAIVVRGSELFEGNWRTIEDLRRLNLFAHAESLAHCVTIPLS